MSEQYLPDSEGERSKFRELTQSVLVTCILMSFITLVGVTGNSLMLRAYIKYKKLRTNFYTVFCSLSIADTIFLLVAAPNFIIDSTLTDSSEGWCKFSNYLMDACNFTSSYLLVVLAVLRAILLTNRNARHQPQPWHLAILSCAIYVIAFATSIPIIETFIYFAGQCHLNTDFSDNARVMDEWLKSLFSVFLPLGMMIVVHFVAHKLGKRYFSDSYSPREKEKSRLVITIIVTFTICQLPLRIVNLYFKHNFDYAGQQAFDPEDSFLTENHDYDTMNDIEFDVIFQKFITAQSYAKCLWSLDKAIRPILYSKLASDLCEAFDEVINCTYCSRAYFQKPLYDQPAAGPVAVDGADQINGHATHSTQDIEVTGTESQTILTESVEVHNFEGCDDFFDEGYGESNSSSSGGSTSNSKSGNNEYSLNRLVSTSSSASATSQTPLVNQTETSEYLDDVV
ncbi:somatostatin receptor type 1 [Elysia marginata]|uniref:Somatostatin receptor type 1 n=1 Tax=Elysia marginata TaxID=1093978 RepID=A0AAV4FRL8_9GAST|nr:somatostatin receptor type 1 [Elysia marginata]